MVRVVDVHAVPGPVLEVDQPAKLVHLVRLADRIARARGVGPRDPRHAVVQVVADLLLEEDRVTRGARLDHLSPGTAAGLVPQRRCGARIPVVATPFHLVEERRAHLPSSAAVCIRHQRLRAPDRLIRQRLEATEGIPCVVDDRL